MQNLIDTLEPVTRGLCEKLLAERSDIRVTQARRTMDEQLHLWAKGRTLLDGKWIITDHARIVTKAPPGSSPHNFGMAFDVCFNGGDPYLHAYEVEHNGESDPRWLELGTLGESLGLRWGGPLGENDRLTWDRPHFERPDWYTASRKVTA